MISKLDKFGMRSSDVAELSGTEFWEVCLNGQHCHKRLKSSCLCTYMYIEPQNGIFSARSLQACDLGLQFILRILGLVCMSWSSMMPLGLISLLWWISLLSWSLLLLLTVGILWLFRLAPDGIDSIWPLVVTLSCGFCANTTLCSHITS